MYENNPFVVEGPPGTIGRTWGAHYRYGPAGPGEKPTVHFDDAMAGRWRYIPADDVPEGDPDGGLIGWHNSYGDWLIRPLTLDDASWVAPDLHFRDFPTFLTFCREEMNLDQNPDPSDGLI